MSVAAPPPPATGQEVVTFWDITRRQFRKNRPAMVALWCVAGLVIAATVAPLVACNIPYVIVQDGEVIEWPLFQRLFDRLIWASGIDIFFNLLLVLAPLWWLGNLVIGASGLDGTPADSRRLAAAGLPLAGLVSLYVVWSRSEQGLFTWILAAGALGWASRLVFVSLCRGANLRERRRHLFRSRLVLGTFFMIVFGLVVAYGEYSSQVRTFRTEIDKLEASGRGWALKPPIFFHPDAKGQAREVTEQRKLRPPSLKWRSLLGTDNISRDVFTRILYGTRLALTIGIIAVSIYCAIGIFLGGLAGYFGGWVDMGIVGILQVMMCIPTMFLLLTIISLFDTRSIFMVMAAIGFTSWPGITRLVRGEFFRQRNIEYVTAAKALGIPERRIIFGHILKNAIGPVLVAAAFGIAGAILAESGLSFLGLGDTNAPSWGQILQDGRSEQKSWLILSPGIAIFFVVTVLNMVGDGLRDALDPKLRR